MLFILASKKILIIDQENYYSAFLAFYFPSQILKDFHSVLYDLMSPLILVIEIEELIFDSYCCCYYCYYHSLICYYFCEYCCLDSYNFNCSDCYSLSHQQLRNWALILHKGEVVNLFRFYLLLHSINWN